MTFTDWHFRAMFFEQSSLESSSHDRHNSAPYADYVKIPDDGRRHEIIDGVHFINGQRHDRVGEESLLNPAPSTYHQIVSARLFFQLFQQIDAPALGVGLHAPCDIQLTSDHIVQPDIIVVLNNRKSIITPTKIKGQPNLVIEILSPSSEETDCVTKREIYQAAGVEEYWIVNPLEHTVNHWSCAMGLINHSLRAKFESGPFWQTSVFPCPPSGETSFSASGSCRLIPVDRLG